MSPATRAQQPAPVPPAGAAPAGSPDLREVWFSLMRFRWSSLGVMPADPRGTSLAVAKGLADIGTTFRGRPVTLIPAESLDLAGTAQVVEHLMVAGGDPGAPGASASRGAAQVVVALSSVTASSMNIPLAMAVDALVLLVEEGVTRLEDVKHTLETVGRERVLGTVLLRPAP